MIPPTSPPNSSPNSPSSPPAPTSANSSPGSSTLVVKGRVSPRRASVLAYITNQLLHSHRSIILETTAAKEETRIINDLPRPQRDWPEDIHPPDDCRPAPDPLPLAWTIPCAHRASEK